MEINLTEIQNKIKFIGNMKTEIPEQLMTCKHLNSNDCVLELGGSIGRNSCIINYILLDKKNHVVVEPSLMELEVLKKNRDNNNFKFQIENSAISEKILFSKGWHTYTENIPGSTPIKILTYNQLKAKYNLNFNTIIADCEGNFVPMLKSFPDILNGINKIMIEHDFNSNEDLQYFYNIMKKNNFNMIDKYLKNTEFGPGMNWHHGVKSDPIFVSVWNK